jgi:bifunctional non-homologous end joining protein LigD
MGLTKYKAKRSFKETPEPQGGKSKGNGLRFVIQKHAASHLHYDFRLEMEGVLKSWAVPKGPSTDPKVKRLAMMVEDHPYDYRTFEGVIPEGNYGAGTVIVWDEGTYEPAERKSNDKSAQDKALRQQLHKGKIKFILHGKKLKGEFALVKAHGRGENGWLLMKLNDEYASTEDVLQNDKSVVTGHTIETMTKSPTALHGKKAASKPRPSSRTPRKAAKKATVSKTKRSRKKQGDGTWTDKGVGKKMPVKLTPMLTTLVDKPFDAEGWTYEIKWDGYRALAFIQDGDAELKSRNDKSFNEKFYPVFEAVKTLGISAILDGEIVVINKEGLSDFGALQNWRSEADGDLFYYVFDIVWLNGKDITGLPLKERRAILKAAIPENDIIRVSDQFETSGTDFYAAAKQMKLEGMIAKRIDSTYQPGARNNDWLKIKVNKRQEVVIGGFTRNDDSSKIFSALLVGVWEKNQLVYTGKIGTGFSDKLQREMMTKFKPLITKEIPFSSEPDINKPSRFRPNPPHATATWLRPELVCEVSFTEMTSDGVMRHPSFEGMRIDKPSREVVLEKEVSIDKVELEDTAAKAKNLITLRKASSDRKTLLNPTEETQVKQIDGHAVKFTNLSKLYWPEDKVTKRDMLNYYYQVAPYILPYLKDRPQSLNRFPNGIHGKSFYQKDVTGKVPDWIKTYHYRSSDDDRDKNFMLGSDEASVLYMASLGCIELNPWSSRIQKPDHPDWCIIDLDPDKNSFEQVITAAQMTRQVLDEMKVPSYCKTSGSTGIHIYIPLGAKYTYEQSKEFARMVVTLVHNELPKFTSIARPTAERKGKIYLDFLQNRPKATLAAPYSLRPKPGATVSMPLHWDEVKKGLKMTDFTIHNAVARIREEGDIFKPVLGKGIEMNKLVHPKK